MARRYHLPHGDYKRYMRVRCAFPKEDDAIPIKRRRPKPAQLIVLDLPPAMTENALRRMMAHFGRVERVAMPLDKATREPKGFGFVAYADGVDLDEVLAKTAKISVGGHPIRVERVKPKSYGGWVYRRSEEDDDKREIFNDRLGIGIVQTDIAGGLQGGYMWAIWTEAPGQLKAYLLDMREGSTTHSKKVLFPTPESAKDWVNQNVLGRPTRHDREKERKAS